MKAHSCLVEEGGRDGLGCRVAARCSTPVVSPKGTGLGYFLHRRPRPAEFGLVGPSTLRRWTKRAEVLEINRLLVRITAAVELN